MRRVTLDASVICKWYLLDAPDEPNLAEAQALAAQVAARQLTLVQPPHWLCETLGVTLRRRPSATDGVLRQLLALPVEIQADHAVYQRAAQLSRADGTHLFDTLYHAVALLEPDGLFITADARYVKAAAAQGQVMLLDSAPLEIKEPPRAYLVPRRERRARSPRRAAAITAAR